MARKTFEELVEEAAAEEREAKAAEPETETVSEPEPTPTPEPEQKAEPEPAPEPAADPEPKAEEPKTEEPKPDPVIDEIDNTNSVIRKRLEKQAKKYEDQMAKMREDYEARLKAVEERTAPKPEVKTRKDFQFDEEYVQYLTRTEMDKMDAEKAKAQAEKDAEAAKQKEAEEAAENEIRQRQTKFVSNIDQCFEGDEKSQFLARVKYANSKGLGTLLDSCPIASDYLLGNPKGPLVLAKILDANNPEYFRRVFPVGGISPLDQYSELKDIERSVMAERNAPKIDPTPSVVKNKPTLGKPGVQGQGGTSGDPMRGSSADRRAYVRNLMGY